MSTTEKIGLAVIVLLLMGMSVFSYHEIKEPENHEQGPNFSESLGQEFKIGQFVSIMSETHSGGEELNCAKLQPVIVAALHDVKARLEEQNSMGLFSDKQEIFEVSQETLKLFCNKNAEITLTDGSRNRLVLLKSPFQKGIPTQGTSDDMGTEVKISTTVISAGAAAPELPSVSGVILIPDRFLGSEKVFSAE